MKHDEGSIGSTYGNKVDEMGLSFGKALDATVPYGVNKYAQEELDDFDGWVSVQEPRYDSVAQYSLSMELPAPDFLKNRMGEYQAAQLSISLDLNFISKSDGSFIIYPDVSMHGGSGLGTHLALESSMFKGTMAELKGSTSSVVYLGGGTGYIEYKGQVRGMIHGVGYGRKWLTNKIPFSNIGISSTVEAQ